MGGKGEILVEAHVVFFRRVFLIVWVDGGYSMYGNKSSILIVKGIGIIGIVV